MEQDTQSLTDSGFASSGSSFQQGDSSASDFNSYIYENGRRYHAYRAGQYPLPNDDREIKRLELHHHLFLILLKGALHSAPLKNPTKILDIGTGAGEWAIDMAEQYTDSEVIGNDLSRIQPSWKPANCVFEVDDVESEWVYPADHFDFIHMRGMIGSIQDWPLIISRCFKHLKPGGYFEFQDHGACLFTESPNPKVLDIPNPVPAPPSPFSDWWELMIQTSEASGRPFQVGREMEGLLRSAGFVDIHVEIKAWPLTPWPEIKSLNEMGEWGRRGMVESLNSFSIGILTRQLGWTEKEVRDKVLAAMEDLMEENRRFWVQAYFVYGKKPDDGQGSDYDMSDAI